MGGALGKPSEMSLGEATFEKLKENQAMKEAYDGKGRLL